MTINLVCKDRNIKYLIRKLFEFNKWNLLTADKDLFISLSNISNYPSFISSKVSADFAATKENIGIILEIKSLLYAYLRLRFKLIKPEEYGYWHTRYHFSDPYEARDALNNLSKKGKIFYDYRQDRIESAAELYRLGLGFLTHNAFKHVNERILGIVMPWYALEGEVDTAIESVKKLKKFFYDKHNLDINMIILKFQIEHDKACNPIKIILNETYYEKPLNLSVKSMDIKGKFHNCLNCKYKNICCQKSDFV